MTNKPTVAGAVPLQGAVLCVNCECVTSGRFDACPVCGSRSLLSISQMLGGTPLTDQSTTPVSKTSNNVLFDLTITIELKQMSPGDVNAAIERISRLIGPRLMQGRACFHTNVEPVAGSRAAEECKAA